MLLRMSTLFLRTLRADPAGAEAPSHRLLLRAGYLRRVASGGYAYLPLGMRVLERIAAAVRAEMTAIGGQEVLLPILLPTEPYQTSGRLAEFGELAFRLQDRRGAPHLLAPTHEEPITQLVKELCSSYRDYPVILYQLQTTFRDEARPRGGLLRSRESLMKDSYSFAVDADGMADAYAAHRAAYQRVIERLELPYTVVLGRSGIIGAARSEEFLVDSPAGEETFVGCRWCGYAANTEAVTTPTPPATDPATADPLMVHDTPDTPTIESLVALANQRRLAGRADWTAADTLKNVVVEVRRHPDADAELVVIGIPGDRELDLKRLAAALYPATVTLFEDWESRPDLVRGYLGPQGLAERGVRYLADPRVVPGSAWLTGANQPGRHATNVVCGRDFVPESTIEAATVRTGDPCPACAHGTLNLRRGIGIGYLGQLGRRFSDQLGLEALGPDGTAGPVWMGSYRLGVSRLLAAVAEQHHDDAGLAWPTTAAPCALHLVPTGRAQLAAAEELAQQLVDRGLSVLLDDRPGVSAGVKFTDAELLGIPHTVVVGRRLTDGLVELRERRSGHRREVPLAEVWEHLRAQ